MSFNINKDKLTTGLGYTVGAAAIISTLNGVVTPVIQALPATGTLHQKDYITLVLGLIFAFFGNKAYKGGN